MKNSSKYLLDADSLIRPFRQHYRPSICPAYWDAIKRFYHEGWLVAYAKANDYLICSYEVSAPQSRNNAKLPDVAAFLGVTCVFPHEMLEELRVRMVLSTRA